MARGFDSTLPGLSISHVSFTLVLKAESSTILAKGKSCPKTAYERKKKKEKRKKQILVFLFAAPTLHSPLPTLNSQLSTPYSIIGYFLVYL
jgi:hypothetical protein